VLIDPLCTLCGLNKVGCCLFIQEETQFCISRMHSANYCKEPVRGKVEGGWLSLRRCEGPGPLCCREMAIPWGTVLFRSCVRTARRECPCEVKWTVFNEVLVDKLEENWAKLNSHSWETQYLGRQGVPSLPHMFCEITDQGCEEETCVTANPLP
jgi:hypothetical protein